MTFELTAKAAAEVRRLKSEDAALANAWLRIKVIGGGCSGMRYSLDLDTDGPAETDKVVTSEGLAVIIDPRSALFLDGTTLDYSDGLNGKGFTFDNPNAKRTCGCGSSFGG